LSHRFVNPFPKYLQIREILHKRLERSEIGDRLPTEHSLCDEFRVSRETVRDALRGLEEDGLVSRRRGRGTFVVKVPRPRTERRLTGLTEDFSALKLDTEARVIKREIELPPPLVAELMSGSPEESVYVIERLRFFSRDHFAHHAAYLPIEVGAQLTRLDLTRTSIMHELRETLAYEIWEDHQRIEATVAGSDMARLLRVDVGAPLLCITRHFLGGDSRTIVVFRSHYRADRYFYTVKTSQDARQEKPRAEGPRRRKGAGPLVGDAQRRGASR
jgi:GntR family transcriptional regulator